MMSTSKLKSLPCSTCLQHLFQDLPSNKSKSADSIGGIDHSKPARLYHKPTKTYLSATNQPTPYLKNKDYISKLLAGRSPKDIILSLKEPSLLDNDLIYIFTKGFPLANTTRYDHPEANTALLLLSALHSTNNSTHPSSLSFLISPTAKSEDTHPIPPSSNLLHFDQKLLFSPPSLLNDNYKNSLPNSLHTLSFWSICNIK